MWRTIAVDPWTHCSQKWTPDGGRNSLDATRFGMAAEKNYAYHLANNANGGNGYAKVS